jgi:hypothetical protein
MGWEVVMFEALSFFLASIAAKVSDPLMFAFLPLTVWFAWSRKWLLVAMTALITIAVNIALVWNFWQQVPGFNYAWGISTIATGFSFWSLITSIGALVVKRLSRVASSP